MGIATSLLLTAVGAVLIWAVNGTIASVDLHTIGWICFIVGILGALVSAMVLATAGRRDGVEEVVHHR